MVIVCSLKLNLNKNQPQKIILEVRGNTDPFKLSQLILSQLNLGHISLFIRNVTLYNQQTSTGYFDDQEKYLFRYYKLVT